MKRLLLILLCLPFIGFGQSTVERLNKKLREYDINIEAKTSEQIFLESKFDNEIRKKMIWYENYINSDSVINKIAIMKYNERNWHTQLYKKLNDNQFTKESLILFVEEYNKHYAFLYRALGKNYDLGDILIDEFDDSFGKLFQPALYIHQTEHLFGSKRTLRTFDEAKQEGTLHIYILRRVASKIIYAILILLAFILIKFLRKRMRKKTNKILTKEMSEKEIT